MKNLFPFICCFLTICCSCSTDENAPIMQDYPSIAPQKVDFDKVKTEILVLDKQYVSFYKGSINTSARKVPGVVWNEVVGADAMGVCASWPFAMYAPTMTSKLLVIASIAVIFSAQEYLDQTEGCQISDFSDISITAVPNFRTIDLRQPIYPSAPTSLYNTNLIGSNVGPLHNRGIIGWYKANRLDPTLTLSSHEVFDSIRSGLSMFNEVSFTSVEPLIDHGVAEFENYQPLTLNHKYGEELSIINHVYDVSLNLDSVTLLDYTNDVMEIVNDAYLDEEIPDSSAWLINASVSTLAHTRLLWKSYLPDYRLTTTYMAFNEDIERWVLCTRSQLEVLCMNNHVPYVGIPGIVDGQCSEIFFYPSSSIFYGVNNSHYHQLNPYEHLDIDLSTSFEDMTNGYGSMFFHKMVVDDYHIREVPNEDHIYYVSFPEP